MLGMLGCLMCIAGSVIIVIHAPQEHPITSVHEIWSMATQPGKLLCLRLIIKSILPWISHCNIIHWIITGNNIMEKEITTRKMPTLPW